MKSCILVPLVASLALPSPAIAACDASTYEALVDSFRTSLDALREREALPGAVAAFWAADCPIALAAAGFADVELQIPMQPDAKFMSGSIGKSFVAALALDLVHRGQLSLDEKIERWLGAEPWFDRLPNAHDITLRMLLNHSSGISDHVFTAHFLVAALRKRFFGDPRVPF